MDKKEMYEYHQENVLALSEGLGFVMDNIKQGIINEHLAKSMDESTEEKKKMKKAATQKAKRYILIQSRILSGLIVSWSEEMIKRLYYEPNAFTEDEIVALHGLNLQEKWNFAFRVAFCKKYKVNNPLNKTLFNHVKKPNHIRSQERTIDNDIKDKYKVVVNLIKTELVPAFNIRNKVQHGEWIKAFKPPNSLEYCGTRTNSVNNETIIDLQTKINQFKVVYQLIHDLAAGRNSDTFECDFNKKYARIESNKHLQTNIRTTQKYKDDIIRRYERGKDWRITNQPEQPNLIQRIINWLS